MILAALRAWWTRRNDPLHGVDRPDHIYHAFKEFRDRHQSTSLWTICFCTGLAIILYGYVGRTNVYLMFTGYAVLFTPLLLYGPQRYGEKQFPRSIFRTFWLVSQHRTMARDLRMVGVSALEIVEGYALEAGRYRYRVAWIGALGLCAIGVFYLVQANIRPAAIAGFVAILPFACFVLMESVYLNASLGTLTQTGVIVIRRRRIKAYARLLTSVYSLLAFLALAGLAWWMIYRPGARSWQLFGFSLLMSVIVVLGAWFINRLTRKAVFKAWREILAGVPAFDQRWAEFVEPE